MKGKHETFICEVCSKTFEVSDVNIRESKESSSNTEGQVSTSKRVGNN